MSELDVVTLSRIQFGLTVGFHFIFVPLTIGMALFVAIVESLYVRTNNPKYKAMAKFWGKLFIINFVLGVVTGLTMEFQFGTNWSQYSEFMGDVFGSPLALEALTAFFLESTFMGIWIWGWDKVSKKMHSFAAWMVAFGTHLSAVWIILANGFMQHPVGYEVVGGRAEMVDFLAVATNPYAWHTYFHTILACWSIGAFFILGVSAWHLLRKQHVDFMRTSLKYGAVFALIATLGLGISGHFNGQNVYQRQPAKFAAMEALWETDSNVPMYLIQTPGKDGIKAIGIPGLASWLATHDASAELTGLDQIPENERPPIAATFWSFRVMIAIGVFLILVALLAWYFDRKDKIMEKPGFLRLLVWTIPVPYISTELGWMVAEIGRQPWTVYGEITTQASVSPISAVDVGITLGIVILMYTSLVVLDIIMLARNAKAGPEVVDGGGPVATTGD